jgi:hypothetical protein
VGVARTKVSRVGQFFEPLINSFLHEFAEDTGINLEQGAPTIILLF